MEKRESEISRMTSKHSQDIGELRFQLQDAEAKRSDLIAELDRLRVQLVKQTAAHDLNDQINQLQAHVDSANRKIKDLQDENERLQEENQSVCTIFFSCIYLFIFVIEIIKIMILYKLYSLIIVSVKI